MNIVEFLTARLDEDQAGVLATTPVPLPGRWKVARDKHADDDAPLQLIQGEDPDDPASEEYSSIEVIAYCAYWQAEAEANLRHIARHDPARVLAEVKAKRAIMALHGLETLELPPAPYELPEGFTGEFVGHCGTCSEVDYPEGLNTYYEPWPCPSLRILASIYDQHPDYDKAWRME